MTPSQCRAARVALNNMSQFELSAAAAVPQKRVMDFEAKVANLSAKDLAAVEAALERAGVRFVPGGIRMTK